jgi:hypothetical protein
VTLNAGAGTGAAGTSIDLAQFSDGIQITDVVLTNDALGAGVSVQVGYEYVNADGVNDDDGFLVAASAAAAGRRNGAFHPILFKKPVKITAKITGGNATGKITVNTKYRFIGI